ncbi:MAG: alanine racemase [Gammaproteobacteria bacterium]|uniref:Alanine racemase n=1 Tax=OM182 bacterium TaxID=2510334 RepID=A0A520S2R6_9GAMM|nr:alanine racemase [Gammaproteobacteria bacterium]OUV68608.1 MAG: alanine racemase [Gammaproteobacteria bacterium TMED133]RZO76754.1 MAG: alanine racemase [OM182 bacterium]
MGPLVSSLIGANVNLNAIKHNLSIVHAKAPKSQVMAIVKADAYGHGAVDVARCLKNADSFGVARFDEALELRRGGIEAPVVILEGILNANELRLTSELQLDLVVHSKYQIDLLNKQQFPGRVWVKVTTGMNRLGFPTSSLGRALLKLKSRNVVGIMSHLASADSNKAFTDAQVETFVSETKSFSLPLSIANSAGVLSFPDSHLDWVRPGIMLYGGSPYDRAIPELKSVMTFSAPVIAINKIHASQSVGYGRTWVAEKDTRVAVLGIGYADGYPREITNGTVILSGLTRKIVGRVSMDMICVELEESDSVAVGETAELWGNILQIEEVAGKSNTIPYTLMCGVGNRVRRNYF